MRVDDSQRNIRDTQSAFFRIGNANYPILTHSRSLAMSSDEEFSGSEPDQGMDSDAIELLPNEMAIDSESCQVCLEGKQGTDCLRLPCLHTFHKACVARWLKSTDRCPLCRYQVSKGISASQPYTDSTESDNVETPPDIYIYEMNPPVSSYEMNPPSGSMYSGSMYSGSMQRGSMQRGSMQSGYTGRRDSFDGAYGRDRCGYTDYLDVGSGPEVQHVQMPYSMVYRQTTCINAPIRRQANGTGIYTNVTPNTPSANARIQNQNHNITLLGDVSCGIPYNNRSQLIERIRTDQRRHPCGGPMYIYRETVPCNDSDDSQNDIPECNISDIFGSLIRLHSSMDTTNSTPDCGLIESVSSVLLSGVKYICIEGVKFAWAACQSSTK